MFLWYFLPYLRKCFLRSLVREICFRFEYFIKRSVFVLLPMRKVLKWVNHAIQYWHWTHSNTHFLLQIFSYFVLRVSWLCVFEQSVQNKSLKIIDFIGFVVDQSLLFYCYIRTYTSCCRCCCCYFRFAEASHVHTAHLMTRPLFLLRETHKRNLYWK